MPNLEILEAQPGSLDAHREAVKAQLRALETKPKALQMQR
jgi:hypothetical protein